MIVFVGINKWRSPYGVSSLTRGCCLDFVLDPLIIKPVRGNDRCREVQSCASKAQADR